MQKLRTETDERLISLYREGNDEAFDVLLERYGKVTYGFIMALVGDNNVADDLFQETFYKVIISIRRHRYVDSGRFQAWLLRVANNVVMDCHRHRSPCVDLPNPANQEQLLQQADITQGNVEDQFHNEQTLEDIHKMIALLPQPQQEVVRLRIFEKLSFKEIAALTNCSINTALGRMRYATLNLRRMAARHRLDLSFIKYE